MFPIPSVGHSEKATLSHRPLRVAEYFATSTLAHRHLHRNTHESPRLYVRPHDTPFTTAAARKRVVVLFDLFDFAFSTNFPFQPPARP